MTIRTIGIDPGISGAIALIIDKQPVELYDMPTMAKASGKGKQVNSHELSRIIQECNPEHAMIELVSAMPGQGVSSMFSFGKSAGIVEGVLAAIGIPFTFVTPQKWKKHNQLVKKDKDAARAKAITQFPHVADSLNRKKDGGKADAIWIGLQYWT